MSTALRAHKTVRRMPRTLRALNALAALAALASAVAVLGSNLADPAYHAHYRDAYWFVLLYGAF